MRNKKKVALIAPPYPLEENPSPPLGICYIASAFESAGAEVIILDYIVRRYTPEKLGNDLADFRPDIVGTNSVTMNFFVAADILRNAKQHNPSIITMMGGPHVTFDTNNTLNKYPEIDVVVIGEGEDTVQEFLKVVDAREKWSSVKGIAFKEKGEIIKTDSREFIKDLDAIPFPARHLLPLSRYQALGFPVSIITSRGCPGRCIFCQGRRMVGKRVRYRSPALVVDEIEEVLSYGFDRINIADDFFTSNKKRVRLLCDEILRRNICFGWSAFVRADSINTECLKTMKEAGCDTVSFGVESGNSEMLKRIRKGITLDRVRSAVDYCKDVGMEIFASFMVGLPAESKETLRDSRDFAESLDIDYGYHFLAPFPGTTVREEAHDFDIEILTDDWNQYDANRAIVRTSSISPEEIEQFVEKYNEECEEDEEEILERYVSGNASELEILRIEGRKRTALIFRLLSEDILENYACLSMEDSGNDTLLKLAQRISPIVSMEIPFVGATISSLMDKGYIKAAKSKTKVNLFWTHNHCVDVYSQCP
ncbi:MAG: radical SAM protein [Proteobacteria bacterium]|nr:radical SAM protein [Pseudomonadota bacterium]